VILGGRHAGGALALAVALVALGCGSAPQPKPPPEPAIAYGELLRERLTAARAEERVYRVRHNPTTCDCPAYELALGDVWYRVSFGNTDPGSTAMRALAEATRAATRDDRVSVWYLGGTLEAAVMTCARGAAVVILVPNAFWSEPPEL